MTKKANSRLFTRASPITQKKIPLRLYGAGLEKILLLLKFYSGNTSFGFVVFPVALGQSFAT